MTTTGTSTRPAPDDAVGWGRYLQLWRAPHMPQLLVGFVLARLPTGMVILALVLSTLERTGSLALSGTVSGCYALGMAVGMPVSGRLVDRRGPLQVLVVTGLLYPAMLLLFASVAGRVLPFGVWTLPVSAALAGLVLPPVAPVVRSVWSATLDGSAARAATAVENTLVTSFYVAGPAVVGILAGWHLTPLSLLLSALCTALGVPLVALHTHARALPRTTGRLRRLEALHQPAIRPVLALLMAYTAGSTGLEFAVIAWADERDRPGLTGLVIAVASVAALLTAVRHGTGLGRLGRVTLPTTYAVWTVGIVLVGVATTLGTGLGPVLVVAVLAESATAPMFALLMDRIHEAASPRLRTESFAWRQTALMVGGAGGAALCGWLSAHLGVTGPAVFGAGVGIAATVLALRRPATD